ncbi:MAG: hypothetical protein NC231_12955 [Bacillus sp. (in: Bacteria)]|nr:hypothetical protein [Bacillus sp. (in: firmicutes)]
MDIIVKKKIVMGIISIGLIVCLGGCGSSAPNASDITVNRTRKGPTAVLEENAKPQEDEETDAVKDIGEEMAAEETVEIAGTKKGIVFGSCEASGYQDFTYLTEELISTSKTASKEEKTFCVYIPKEGNPRVSKASARSEEAGVYVKVDLEPYLQYQSENYSIRANLQKYIDGEMDYYENYHDVMIGNIEEIEDGAVCEVSYMEYDSYEDAYTPYYAVYSLYDLGDNVTALVTLFVNADNMTQETGKIIEELSSFYQMDISWDESFAQTRREKFENKYRNVYTVDCLTFNLPDGWEIDEEVSDEYETFFAPDGDSQLLGLCIYEAEEAFGVVDVMLENTDEMQEMLEEELGSEWTTITDAGITFLGRTVVVETTIYSEDGNGTAVYYIAEDDNNLYMMYAYCTFEDEEKLTELTDEVQEAVSMFMETGRVTDSFM